MFSKKFTTVVLTLTVILSQVLFPEPAKALGTPRIVSISPGSPSPVGSRVCIRAEVTWDSDFRSMRIRFGNEGWNESAEINFERCFETGHLSAGWYTIRVEVAKVNEGWESATSTEQSYELTQQNNDPPAPTNPQVSCSINSFEVWPNPATVGEVIHIRGSGSCNTQVRATKVKINGNDYYEIGGATTLETTWNATSVGDYNLTLLVTGDGDNDWQNAASQNITIQVYTPTPNIPQEDNSSNNPNDVFQHRDVIKIGYDIFVIISEGSAIQRRHVPNPETLDALGISRNWINNRGFTDEELRSIGQGSDIPDVVRDPDGFETFKNTYFSDTQPISPQQNNNNSQNNVEVPSGQFDPHAKGVCDGWETRLWVGAFARVTNQGDLLKLRTGPSLQDAVIDKLPSGYKFMVIGGPTCVDTYTWWNIQGEGGAGWAAEAGERWWIAPMTEPPTPDPVVLIPEHTTETPNSSTFEESPLVDTACGELAEGQWWNPFNPPDVGAAEQCTNFVARVNSEVGKCWGGTYPNAGLWDDWARDPNKSGSCGWSVSNALSNAEEGDIVVWNGYAQNNGESCAAASSVGHVAIFVDDNEDGTIQVNGSNWTGNQTRTKFDSNCMAIIHIPGVINGVDAPAEPESLPEPQPEKPSSVDKCSQFKGFRWILCKIFGR